MKFITRKKLFVDFNSFVMATFCLILALFIVSCEKEQVNLVTSNDAIKAREAYKEKGYIELEVVAISKQLCYFQEWDKTILIPVEGLYEYYNSDSAWVASINFGDGNCDEWVTKTWDTTIFPDYPSGSDEFSVFSYFKKKN